MRWTGGLALIGILVAGCGTPATAPRPVPLALDFTPNAVHAGIYQASLDEEDGNGIDLQPRAPGASTDSLKLLTSGRADFAVLDIHDLGLAREQGEDVVGVGAIVQEPLAAVIARDDVRRPRDLEGKRVGVTGLPSDDAVLRSVVENDGGDISKVDPVTIGFSAVPSLVSGKVDAVVTFWNAEGVALRQRDFPVNEFRVDDYGAPRYPELVLATTGEIARAQPDLVDDVLAALAAGNRAVAADPAIALKAITQASEADQGLVEAQYKALAGAFDGAPELDRKALEDWSRFDARFGILKAPIDVNQAFPAR
ncbi:MAG: putative hydroxymethylpyrimidine transport system substrate-binding protein [Thermoleophilaceae bacterium]|nr:putative hydroxymethylpyrimidine transport system substrate-binding protein [Thermoleophilaceae bacterium]